MSAWKGVWENVISGKQVDSVQRGDSCSLSHGSNRGQRAQSSSPARKAQTQVNGRKPSQGFGPRGESPSGRKGEKACKVTSKEIAQMASCDHRHPPVCQNYKSESGCKFSDTCLFSHTEADGQPSKKSKKSGGKGSVALLKECKQLGCVSQDTEPSMTSTPRKGGKLGPNRAVTFSKGTWHHKKRERKGPWQGDIQKCEPQERNACAPKFGGQDTSGNFATRTMRPQRSMGFGEKCLLAQKKGQGHVLLAHRSMGTASTLFEETRGETLCGRFWSIDAHAEQKKISAQPNWKPFKNPGTTQNGDHGPW